MRTTYLALALIRYSSPSALICASATASWLSVNPRTLVDGDTIERLLGVKLEYVEWCIGEDGGFENGGGGSLDNWHLSSDAYTNRH